MKMKYIMFDETFPVVFGEYFTHKDVTVPNAGKPTSAGFFSIQDGKVQTYGVSVSLELKSKPEDAFFIQHLLGTAN